MQKCKIWLFALMIGASPALAQGNDDLNTRREAAHELFASREQGKIIEALIKSIADNYTAQMRKAHPELLEQQLTALQKGIEANLTATENDYLSREEDILSERLSLDDLRAAIAFYKSDAGKRLANIAPDLIPDAGKNQVAWASAAIKKATDDINTAAKAGK